MTKESSPESPQITPADPAAGTTTPGTPGEAPHGAAGGQENHTGVTRYPDVRLLIDVDGTAHVMVGSGGDRVAFDRGRRGPVYGTVVRVAVLINGTCSHAVEWIEDLDGTLCRHNIDDPRLTLVKRP